MRRKGLIAAGLLICLFVCTLFYLQANAEETGLDKETNNFKVIEGWYNKDNGGWIYHKTDYRVTNTSLSNYVTLGNIWVLGGPTGIHGTPHTYTGLVGTAIAPLGALSFQLHNIGVDPSGGGGAAGPYTVVVAYTGEKSDLKLTGKVSCYWESTDSPNGYFDLQSK